MRIAIAAAAVTLSTVGFATTGTAVAADGADAPADKSTALAEIIVTAEKREERLQDTPISMTVINTTALAANNEVRLQDYATTIPGLNVVLNDYGTPQLVIRGITTGGYINPTVGVTVDDVPFGSSTALALGEFVPDFDPSDISNIEVLRGPQGTLYGASSIGGLVRYVTRAPSTEGFTGRVEAGVDGVHNGNEPGYSFRGEANIPLSDSVAIRVSGFTRQDAGYVDDPSLGLKGVNEGRTSGGYLSALFPLPGSFSLRLTALVQKSTADGLANVDAKPGLGDLQQEMVRGSGRSDRQNQAYIATIKGNIGNTELTSVTGYNISRNHSWLDYSDSLSSLTQKDFGVSGAPIYEPVNTNKFTQELRASIPLGDRVDWLIGGFYTHEASDSFEQIFAAVPATGAIVGTGVAWLDKPITFDEYAVFTDFTVHFSDRFDVQLGGRQSYNRQAYTSIATGTWVPVFYNAPAPYVEGPARSDDHSFTYLLTPRFKISPDLMVYARLASGYQPGGPNIGPTGSTAPSEFKAETTKNYEVGLKGNAWDHKLSFDGALYYISWSNLQLYLTNPDTGTSYYANGSGAKSQGVELSVQARPVTGLTLSAWLTYGEAELTRAFPSTASAYGPKGDRLPYGTRISGNLAAQQSFPLVGEATGFVGARWSYVGDRVGQFTSSPQRQEYPGYGTVMLNTGVHYGSWNANLYVNNLLDKRGLLDGGLGTFDALAFQYIQPRTVGLTVAKEFN